MIIKCKNKFDVPSYFENDYNFIEAAKDKLATEITSYLKQFVIFEQRGKTISAELNIDFLPKQIENDMIKRANAYNTIKFDK